MWISSIYGSFTPSQISLHLFSPTSLFPIVSIWVLWILSDSKSPSPPFQGKSPLWVLNISCLLPPGLCYRLPRIFNISLCTSSLAYKLIPPLSISQPKQTILPTGLLWEIFPFTFFISKLTKKSQHFLVAIHSLTQFSLTWDPSFAPTETLLQRSAVIQLPSSKATLQFTLFNH